MYKIVERMPGVYEIDSDDLTHVLVPHGNKLLAEQICHAMNHGVRTIRFSDERLTVDTRWSARDLDLSNTSNLSHEDALEYVKEIEAFDRDELHPGIAKSLEVERVRLLTNPEMLDHLKKLIDGGRLTEVVTKINHILKTGA